jgi:hypothetical protein
MNIVYQILYNNGDGWRVYANSFYDNPETMCEITKTLMREHLSHHVKLIQYKPHLLLDSEYRNVE